MDIQQLIPRSTTFFDTESMKGIKSSYPLKPFDKHIIDFLAQLSRKLLENKEFNRVPALTALGYWLRKSNLDRIYKENLHLFENENILCSPAGLVFHVCPSNVDTIFIYSFAVSLLAGNKNIIRLSHRANHPYIQFLLNTINSLVEKPENAVLKEYIYVVSYGHDDEVNAYFSQHADIRVLWGGDNTINLFRNYKIAQRSKDIVFADRLSYAIFGSNEFLKLANTDIKELVRKFYNDSFTFDQLGCSSPQLIFFIGSDEDNTKARQLLYDTLLEFAIKNYDADMPSISSLKFNKLVDDALDDNINSFYSDNYHLVFATFSDSNVSTHSCGAGYFYTKCLNDVTQIFSFINKKVQTISYYGIPQETILEIVNNTAGSGCDRIVPIGKALDFDYIWDGYNLLEELTVKKHFIT